MSGAATAPNLVHPAARLQGGGLARLITAGVFLAAMLVACAVLLHFHNRFWWAPGEGFAAEGALQALAGGGVPGLLDLINALAFRIFGLDLVSLRYPLVVLAVAQTALVFWLLSGRGVLLAFAGAMAMICLTFVQFLNPAAEWYALFLCLSIIAVLWTSRGEARGDLEAVGFLLAALFLFQATSGAFAAVGVLSFLLLRELRPAERAQALLARGLLLALFAGVAIYLRAAADLFSALLFGAPALLLLGYAMVTTGLGTRPTCRLLGRLAAGALLALAPMAVYHLVQGTLETWLLQGVGTFAAAPMTGPGHGVLVVQALEQIFAAGDRAAILNGVFWLTVPLLPAALGLSLLRALLQGEAAGRAPLPIVACFFALSLAQSEAPVSLFFTTALTVAGLLYLAADAGRHFRHAFAGACLVIALLGLTYQAGQPLSRGWKDMVAGRSKTIVAPLGLPRASLVVSAGEATLYGLLVNLIQSHSSANGRILALPANPELAFLAERSPVLPQAYFANALDTEAALQRAERALAAAPPSLLIYRPGDTANTAAVRRLVAGLRGRYRLLETAGGFEIYLLMS